MFTTSAKVFVVRWIAFLCVMTAIANDIIEVYKCAKEFSTVGCKSVKVRAITIHSIKRAEQHLGR